MEVQYKYKVSRDTLTMKILIGGGKDGTKVNKGVRIFKK